MISNVAPPWGQLGRLGRLGRLGQLGRLGLAGRGWEGLLPAFLLFDILAGANDILLDLGGAFFQFRGGFGFLHIGI